MKQKEIEQVVEAEVRPAETEANENETQDTPDVKKESKLKAFGKKVLEKGKKALPAITGIAGIGVGALIMSKITGKAEVSLDDVQELVPESVKDSVSEVTETAVEAAVDQISD